MGKDSANRRAWIKNIIIIFLVIMLLLTFFSNTILNYTLPEVSAQYAQYGSITNSIKVDGTVKANESYSVIYEADQAEADNGTLQSRKVMSVYVKEGDMVEKDSPIIALKGGASDQLEAVQKEYDELKKTYDLALLNDGVKDLQSSKTIDEAKRAVESAKKTLANLQEELTAVSNGSDTTSIIKARIEGIEDEISSLEDSVSELNEQITACTELKSELETKKANAKAEIQEDIFSNLTVAQKLTIAEDEYSQISKSYEELNVKVEKYKERLDEIKGSSGDISKANELTNQIKSLKEQIKNKEKEIERFIEDYRNSFSDEKYNSLFEEYQSAKNEYDKISYIDINAYKETKKQLENKINEYTTLITEISSYEGMYGILKTDENNITEAEKLLAEAEAKGGSTSNAESYKSQCINIKAGNLSKYQQLVSKLNDTYNIEYPFDDGIHANVKLEKEPKDILSAREGLVETETIIENYNSIESAYETAKTALDNHDVVEVDSTTYKRKLEDYENELSSLKSQLSDAQDKLDIIGLPEVDDVIDYAKDYDLEAAQSDYDEANTKLTEIKEKYETAKTKVESLRKQNSASAMIEEYDKELAIYKDDLDKLNAQVKTRNNEIKAANKRLSEAQKDLSEAESNTSKNPEDIKKQIEETQTNIKNLEAQLKITQAENNQSDKTDQYEREDQKKTLLELEAKIEEYKNAPETTSVTAPIAGRIVSIDVVPGNTVTSGNTVARIEIADKGYICEIPLAAEEARKIQVGAECTISNSWWYSSITASVSQIRPDPQSQGKKRIVVIDVSGDVYEGQSLKFSIGDRSQSYDCVLPNSAIREDNEGKFVLTVTAKDTPLGTRYTAVRTNIEIIASDDTKSAVSGLYGSEFVITNSTTPISDKQQVRLADNN